MTRALATGSAVEGLEWWNGIDESEQWQKGIYSALSSSYGLLSIIALVQLIRIQIRVPEFEWTTQKGFHLMNFIVNGCKIYLIFYLMSFILTVRAIIFGLYKSVFLIRPKVLEMVVMEIPGLLFFSTYTLLVLFWAEIYHQARSLPIRKLKPTYCIINGVMYIIQICIWIIVMLDQSPGAIIAAKLFFSVVAFSAAVGFLIYGGRLFVMLRQFPIESRGRQKKLYEVGFVTSICFSCFSIRCLVLALSAFDKDADLDLVEIVPSALVLFILRKLPPRRISDRYHPIE
ncbi:Tobamovirus multiplication protein 1 [Cucurbita argyrosperma subsp. argyrosperma]|nr:Tobamovirus multiplication protein 1 [Cucurbita argyrosperma subsp. argyrosperma]